MAAIVLKNAVVEINATSAFWGLTRKVTVNYEADEIETTSFTSSTGLSGKTFIPGLVNWTADIEVLQDYSASLVDATLFPLIGATDFPVRIAVSSTGVSTAYPQFTGRALLPKYTPISGGVGEAGTVSFTFRGSGVLLRNTACCSGW